MGCPNTIILVGLHKVQGLNINILLLTKGILCRKGKHSFGSLLIVLVSSSPYALLAELLLLLLPEGWH